MSEKYDSKPLNDNDSKTSGAQDIKKPFNKLSFSLSLSKNTNNTLTAEETIVTDSSLQRQHLKKEISPALKIKEISMPPSKVSERASDSEAKNSSDSHSSDSSSFGKPLKPIKLKLMTGTPKVAGVKRPAQEGKKLDLSEVFNEDDQPEEEEMPLEAKMRMRNIGKDTPTASGPNSFNKGKLGFCNQAKMLERQLKQAFEPPEKIKKKF